MLVKCQMIETFSKIRCIVLQINHVWKKWQQLKEFSGILNVSNSKSTFIAFNLCEADSKAQQTNMLIKNHDPGKEWGVSTTEQQIEKGNWGGYAFVKR